ncbi:DUF3791 domain-containing protein [uncultured Adlercreutzia sp.]|uniref:DUF3791 domain-containing protein n=1 Tax=uncultured Adlercreutzia sp. TaxID=875803 RepID=UPI0025D3E117|nr:DUF3791 domain-containing protein [uncultured Adlercreutzia sp.]MCI9262515.1 DUF3791 domain-containing protein [Eggerthellaceae bacterium]
MLDEVLFMQTRLFRRFWQEHHMTLHEALALFESHRVWDFIESCYDALLTSSDDCALADINHLLASQGVAL